MDSIPSILDDKQIRGKISKAIEKAQQVPFSAALKKWLEKRWNARSRVDHWQPSTFSLMARKEDVGIIQGIAKKYKLPVGAFYVYWDAGLFDEARALIESSEEVRAAIGFTYQDEAGHSFEVCERLAQWGVRGRCQEMLEFMAAIHGVGRSLRHGLQGRVIHQLWGYKTLILTGPRGTEKLLIAHAVHGLSKRAHIEVIDCSQLSEDPKNIVERCQYQGTVFLQHFDQLPSVLRSPLLQTINQGRLLKTIRGTGGVFVERQDLDTLFILGMDRKYPAITGYLADESVIGTTGLVKPVPPLGKRIEDIPLWVNQCLLAHEETRLDDARHLVAATLKECYEKQRLTGEVGGLLKNVTGLVIEFSPKTTLPEATTGIPMEGALGENEGENAPPAPAIDVREADRSVRVKNSLFANFNSRQWEVIKVIITAYQEGRPDIKKDHIMGEILRTPESNWLGVFDSRLEVEGRPRRGCRPTAERLNTALIVSGEHPGTVRLNPRLLA